MPKISVTNKTKIVPFSTVLILVFTLFVVMTVSLEKKSTDNSNLPVQRIQSQDSDLKISPSEYFLSWNKSGSTPKLIKLDENVTVKVSKNHFLLSLHPRTSKLTDRFDYDYGNLGKSKSVTVSVRDGQQIYFFRDAKLVYSHRYQARVFIFSFMDQKYKTGKTSEVQGMKYSISFHNLSLSKIRELIWYSSMLLLLFLGIVGCALFFPISIPRILNESKFKLSYFNLFTSLSWMWCLTSWFIDPRNNYGLSRTPFTPTDAAFSDFYQVAQAGRFPRPYEAGTTNYPPFAVWFMSTISHLPSLLSLMTIYFIAIIVMYFFLKSNHSEFVSKNWFWIVFCYPMIFAMVRGNIDIAVCTLIMFFLALWKRNSTVAAFLLGLAIALKTWPIFLLLAFVKARKFRLMMKVLLFTALTTLGANLFLGYLRPLSWFNNFLVGAKDVKSGTTSEFYYSYGIKSLALFTHLLIQSSNPIHIGFSNGSTNAQALSFVNGPWWILITVLTAIFLIYMSCRASKVSNALIYAASIPLLLQSPAYTYRGILIVVVLVYKFAEISRNGIVDQKYVIWLKFAMFFCVIPSTFIFVKGSFISTSSIIQPLAVICALIAAIFEDKIVLRHFSPYVRPNVIEKVD
jgi:hypothetical protein